MLPYMNYRPQTLETIINGAEKYRAENFWFSALLIVFIIIFA
jgi:hypothetical protein